MNIIFWLEFPLFHVAPLVKSLSLREDVDVIVITEFDIPQWRVDMGFSKPDFGLAKEWFCPDKQERVKLLSTFSSRKNYHIFHGLRHVKENFKCFKKLIYQDAFVGLYFEPQQFTGTLKARLRMLYYRFLVFRYGKKVDFMLALGDLGAKQYIDIGIPENKVFPFEYHFDKLEEECQYNNVNEKLTFLYAGQLVERKNLLLLLRAISLIVRQGYSEFEFFIIGEGVERDKLKGFVLDNQLENVVYFLNSIPSDELKSYYLSADAFVLPSKFEGWGAVASEAMSFGLPLIISDGCASSCIVKDDNHGFVFENNLLESLERALILFIRSSEKLLNQSAHEKRIKYAESYLSGEAGSRKLVKIIDKIGN